MSNYRTIKELVIETCMAEGALPSSEKLTSLVRQHFPNSKWSETHYAWYKSKIKTGGIVRARRFQSAISRRSYAGSDQRRAGRQKLHLRGYHRLFLLAP